MALLEVNEIQSYYGNIQALKGVSLYVDEGEIVSLIGGNGAGKTTTLRTISGLMRPRYGSITFKGEDLSKYEPHELVSQGIAMVPEGRGVFAKLTVAENLEMGLAMARAMMSRPSVLLLDEPSMGLAPVLVDTIFDTVVEINKNGTTVLLVEQNAHMALQVADRGYVLQTGEIVLTDSADVLQSDPTVQKAYLGID